MIDVVFPSLHMKRVDAEDAHFHQRVNEPVLCSGLMSRFAAPVCESDSCHHDAKEPTIAQLLQEKTLYSFSEWPKVACLNVPDNDMLRMFSMILGVVLASASFMFQSETLGTLEFNDKTLN